MKSLLIADIGGTNARFVHAREPYDPSARLPQASALTLPSADFDAFDDLLAAALARLELQWPEQTVAVFAVAGPVAGDAARVTNRSWAMNARDIKQTFRLARVGFLNDLVAAVWGLSGISRERIACRRLQAGEDGDGRHLLLNVGTGLGAAYWSGQGETLRIDGSEAGHTGFAPNDAEQLALFRHLRERHGRVSWERILSGPGLAMLADYLGVKGISSPNDVVPLAHAGDRSALDAIAWFSALLGVYAGDLALCAPAFGGVWLVGGVLDGLGSLMDETRFLSGFHSKGRMTPLLERVPVFRVEEQQLGLKGAWRVASDVG